MLRGQREQEERRDATARRRRRERRRHAALLLLVIAVVGYLVGTAPPGPAPNSLAIVPTPHHDAAVVAAVGTAATNQPTQPHEPRTPPLARQAAVAPTEQPSNIVHRHTIVLRGVRPDVPWTEDLVLRCRCGDRHQELTGHVDAVGRTEVAVPDWWMQAPPQQRYTRLWVDDPHYLALDDNGFEVALANEQTVIDVQAIARFTGTVRGLPREQMARVEVAAYAATELLPGAPPLVRIECEGDQPFVLQAPADVDLLLVVRAWNYRHGCMALESGGPRSSPWVVDMFGPCGGFSNGPIPAGAEGGAPLVLPVMLAVRGQVGHTTELPPLVLPSVPARRCRVVSPTGVPFPCATLSIHVEATPAPDDPGLAFLAANGLEWQHVQTSYEGDCTFGAPPGATLRVTVTSQANGTPVQAPPFMLAAEDRTTTLVLPLEPAPPPPALLTALEDEDDEPRAPPPITGQLAVCVCDGRGVPVAATLHLLGPHGESLVAVPTTRSEDGRQQEHAAGRLAPSHCNWLRDPLPPGDYLLRIERPGGTVERLGRVIAGTTTIVRVRMP